MAAHFARHRRQGFEIGKQIADVIKLDVLVGGVGKRRIEIGAARRRSLPQRSDEIRLAPAADPIFGVRRDIRHVKGAERRSERQAAAEPRAVDLVGVLVGYGMAGRTAADREHGAAVVEIGRIGRQGRGGNNRRQRQQPEGGKSQRCGGRGEKRERSQCRHAIASRRDPNLIGIPGSGKYSRKRKAARPCGRPPTFLGRKT